jgi:outer membrane lipoprotein SlyB
MHKPSPRLVTRGQLSASEMSIERNMCLEPKARPGYVRNWTEKVEIACEGAAMSVSQPKVDNNDCSQGSVIGGLLGAGVGAALSRDKGRWVGVPVGAAAGALVGCQVDGG